jgi:hypothetical protein
MFKAVRRNNRANKSTSLLKCRNLDSKGEKFNWNKYRQLSKDIAACAKRVRSIRTAVLVSMIVLHGPDRQLIQYSIAHY